MQPIRVRAACRGIAQSCSNKSLSRPLTAGNEGSDFLTLSRTASVSRDKARIKELWEPIVKTWFTEGKDDPRITVIKVTPTDGYYWDTKHGAVIAGAKMLGGGAIGKTLDDSVEGQLMF